MNKSHKLFSFKARLYKVGINRCVNVPDDIASSLGKDKYIPVTGGAGGLPIKTTLVPAGSGKYRLFIHSSVWRTLGIDEGELIDISIKRDTASREIPIPPDIAAAFPEGSELYEALQGLTVTHRSGFIGWVENAKTLETREKRILTGIDRILETHRRAKK
ncbi:YdeI/OmpD-associated family protein [candidate division KSB1 bacterium]